MQKFRLQTFPFRWIHLNSLNSSQSQTLFHDLLCHSQWTINALGDDFVKIELNWIGILICLALNNGTQTSWDVQCDSAIHKINIIFGNFSSNKNQNEFFWNTQSHFEHIVSNQIVKFLGAKFGRFESKMSGYQLFHNDSDRSFRICRKVHAFLNL